VEARKLLLGDPTSLATRPARLPRYDGCIGLVRLNGDRWVHQKLAAKKQSPIVEQDRRHLVTLACADDDWLSFDYYGGYNALMRYFPKLRFEDITMNGADDVVKYRKWAHCNVNNRGLCMLRPGFSEELLDGMRRDGVDPDDGVLILGPEMPDLSSTQARLASARGDREEVLKVLHPSVADWLLARDANGLELHGWKEETSAKPGSRSKFKKAAKPKRH
jgi:hypothetical protein